MDSNNISLRKIEKKITDFGAEKYNLKECTFGKLIGHGAAMEVFEGQCNIKISSKLVEKTNVAFKRHKDFKMPSKLKQSQIENILKDFQHEIELMGRLKNHPNVVQIYGVTFKEHTPILIVELGNETLDRYLLEKVELRTPANWVEKSRLCLDVLRGICGLHKAGIIHGDIKGENVLVFIKSTGIAIAKLSDFGFASTLTSSKGLVGGTTRFMAPEGLGIYPELKPWEDKAPTRDIFSFGLLTYQIAANGKKPYEDSENIMEAKDTDRDMKILLADLPRDTPKQFRRIIISTTRFKPTNRASLDSVEQTIWEFLDEPSRQHRQHVDIIKQTSTTSFTWRIQAKNRLEEYAKKIVFNLEKDDINEFHDKRSPLVWSVCEGDVEVIKLLVEDYNTDINAQFEGWTPLHFAASNGNIEIVRLLVTEYKVDPSTKTSWADPKTKISSEYTPLHLAALSGHVKVVKLLLAEYKMDANARAGSGHTPLHLAAQNGDTETMQLIIKYGGNANAQNIQGFTPLHLAAKNGKKEALSLLLTEYKVNVDAINIFGTTPLHYAAMYGHSEIVKLLVTKWDVDASVQSNDRSMPLHYAAMNGHIEVVKFLITVCKVNAGANSHLGLTPLHLAAESGHIDVVKLLLAKDEVDPNAQSNNGCTPLELAMAKQRVEIVRLLANKNGSMAFYQATQKRIKNAVKMLKSAKADASRFASETKTIFS